MKGQQMVGLRVCIVIGTFIPIPGGAEKQALIEARGLRDRGFETQIVTLQHSPQWPRSLILDGVPVVRIGGRFVAGRQQLPMPLRKLAYIVGVAQVGWALWRRRGSYDFIHAYLLDEFALACALVCRITRAPLVVSVRAAPLASGTMLASGAPTTGSPGQKRSTRRRAAAGGDIASLRRFGTPAVALTRWLLRSSGVTVTILSSGMREYLAEHGFSQTHIEHISNGVDTQWFSPRTDTSGSAHSRRVIYVGRLAQEKGLDVLLLAWQLVVARCPDAHLTMVGSGPLEPELRRQVDSFRLTNNVTFTGEQGDVRAHLHDSGMFVLPSRTEGMSNALLEAMACGLACVATRVSGTEDLVLDGVNGLLVDPEDSHVLSRALLRLLHDPQLAGRLGIAARHTVESHYAIEDMLSSYEALYWRMKVRSHIAVA